MGKLLRRIHYLLNVVAVALDDLPAKRAIAVIERLHVHHVFHPAVDLQTVAVNDAHQVIEFVV